MKSYSSLSTASIFGGGRRSASAQDLCPVCSSQGCTLWAGGAVSCTKERSGFKGDTKNGYQFIKSDGVGLGLWKPEDPNRGSSRQKHHSLSNKQIISRATVATAATVALSATIQEEPEEAVSTAPPTDFDKRDQQLRQWAIQSPLSPVHMDNLLGRGLTGEQIEEAMLNGLVFSPYWGDNPDHDHLPGRWDTKRPGYSGAIGIGLVCQQYVEGSDEPVLLGFQVGTEKAYQKAKGGKGKYLWGGFNRNAQISQFGANPITVHRTGNESKHVVMCEGTLKPLVAFYRAKDHGIDLGAAIMAPAGTIWAAPETFAQIETQCKLLGVREIHLALDAGAVKTYEVMMAVSKLARTCLSKGYELKIIWYGQFDKSDGDIDELSAPVSYRLYSLGELQALLKASGRFTAEEKEKVAEVSFPKVSTSPLTASEGFERNFGYLPNHGAELVTAILTHRVTALRAGKGTGKTQLAKLVAEIAEEQSRPVFLFVHRLRLGESLGSLFGLPLKQEVMQMGDYLGYAITVDSAHPRSGMKFDGSSIPANALVIIDEADQVFSHVCSATTAIEGHRDEVVYHLSLSMARAQNVLIMSADLADRELELVRESVGASADECLAIVNTHQRDLGQILRYQESYEVVYAMAECLENGGRFIGKLSGQKDNSITGTQTLAVWLRERFPDKKGLVLDSSSLKNLTVPMTTDTGTVKEVRLLEYISHPDEETRIARQSTLFGEMHWLLFTNACSTGISLEAGGFTDFFQIEQGKGSVADILQATARYRPTNVQRHVYVTDRCLNTIGNGSSDPNKLSSDKDGAWGRQVMAVASVGCEWLLFEPIEYLSKLGRLWSNYAVIRACEFNEQGYQYSESFFDAAEAEGYKISVGFNGTWQAMSKAEQKKFKNVIKSARDRNFDAKNKAEADELVEGLDLKVLLKKRETSTIEDRQIVKLKAMDRYGLEAEEVTADIIKADKGGLYQRLLMRLYVEVGTEQTAKRDKAEMADKLNKGRMWTTDLLRRTSAHKVDLLEQLGIPEILAHLKGTDENGAPNFVTKDCPLVIDAIAKAIELRDDIKQSLGSTVGSVTKIFDEEGKVAQEIVDVNRPISILQTLFKRLELNLASAGQITKEGNRVHKFVLKDLLMVKGEAGSAEDGGEATALSPVIDYERFRCNRLKKDEQLILDEPESPIFAKEMSESSQKSALCLHVRS